MTRARTLCLLTLLACGCSSPPAQAREGGPAMKEADQLFTSGKYDAALQKYDALQKSASDERAYVGALFRAVECETLLAQHEQALDRVRAARVPADPGLRAIVALGRIETFRAVSSWYGFSDETEEGAEGSAKLSRAAADREEESAAQTLWKDREKLARIRLGELGDFLTLKDVDFSRYPSLWDFVVLRLAEWLGEKKGRSDAGAFTVEDFPRRFDAGQPALARIGALYEESAHLSGGSVDRSVAEERWRVARVLLGVQAGGGAKQREAFGAAAIARLGGWARSFSTPIGRADAAAKTAALLYGTKRAVEAVRLIDDVLPKTPESDVAVELRQLRHQILQTELSLSTRTTRDGKKALKLTARNLGTAWLRLYRVDPLREAGTDFFSQTLTSPRYDRVESWVSGRKPVVEWKVPTGDKGDHLQVESDVDAPAPGVGLYLVAVSSDGAFTPRKSTMRAAFVNVTDLAIARAEERDGLRYYAFDVDGKAPAPSVKFELQVSHDWRTRSSDETRTGAEGVASYAFPRAPYVQIDALAVRGQAVALFGSPSYHGQRSPEPPLSLFLATDRPIYRPGQTAHVRVTSIERVRDGSFKIDAHRKLHLVLNDPNGKTVAQKDLVTGAMGSASVELPLPQKGLLGAHTLYATAPGMRDVSAGMAIRVEEYKRPEFEVTLDAPKAAAKYGETTRLTGSVKYYFGGAASDVPVKFKVSRQRWIPWWYWRQGSSPKVEIARGDVKTDKQGEFTVEFTAAPDPDVDPSEDPELPDVSDFVVEVEAHDAGGRTISADCSLRVGAQSLLVSAEAEHGFFLSDEKPLLRVKATNLEEQPIAGEVSWELERLGAPKDKPAPSGDMALQAVLKKYPSAGSLQRGSVKLDGKQPADLRLDALPAGGYRVRLTSGGARGAFAFLVADAKRKALSLTLPPIALARTSQSQPGERAELLVGSSAASGHYHVELWRGERLVEHRVEKGAPVRVWTIPVGAREAGGFTARWIGVDGVDVVGSDLDVRVPREDKDLTVKLVGKPESLEPGQGAKWTVEVRDKKGRPVEGEALVTVYDRSLELYAKSSFGWATQLWAAPPSPQRRTDGVTTGWATALPDDEARAQREQKQIQGSYKPAQLPRFSWEQSRYGYRSGYYMSAVGGAPPPAAAPAEATTVALPRGRAMAKNRLEATGEKDNDGIVDEAEKKESGGEGKKEKIPPGDLRTHMAETAAWVPDLKLGADGRGTLQFKAPERLTSWRVQLLALGRAVEAGTGEDTFATKKPLMVRVEIPRFFREGDRSTIVAVVHNETAQALSATVELDVVGADDNKSALDMLGVKERSKRVDVPAHGLAPVEFAIVAPDTIATYKIRAHAQGGKLSDAEERLLPVLPSRERLVQSRVVALKGNDQQTIRFDELLHSTDPSLRSEAMTVSIDPQLALAVLRSIPYLVEYPYECVEQTLNRYVPLAIVGEIYKKRPELARAIAVAPHRETQNEPWLSDDPRRMLALVETPWLVQSQGGSRDARLRDLLNPTLVSTMGERALDKLHRAQLGSGAFPWFPGGRDDFYMTLYVLEQLSMLQDFGIAPPSDVIQRALGYVARELPQHLKKDEPSVAFLAYGGYVITSFDPKRYPQAAALRPQVEKWMQWVLENRQILTPFGRAWCARTMARLGDRKTALELLDSALDGSKEDPVVGVYWTPERYSWMWYSDSVEKHAFFLRTLAELKPDDKRVPGMLQWLLFNRKGNQWHSTKASAAAVYSILDLMQKMGSLSKPETFHLRWALKEQFVTVRPDEDRRAPLQWTVKGRDVKPQHGEVKLDKQGPGIAFASATWIFSSTKLQDAHPSNLVSPLVSIDRKYFVKVHEADGDHLKPLASGDKVRVGDEIEVRLNVKTKSQFEYVHVKEPRGAGFEETMLTSGWTWDRLPAYQEPRDSLFNFFVSWLPHGEYELRHSLRPTMPGRYRIGSATLQSMYSPDITAYSAGMELEVTK